MSDDEAKPTVMQRASAPYCVYPTGFVILVPRATRILPYGMLDPLLHTLSALSNYGFKLSYTCACSLKASVTSCLGVRLLMFSYCSFLIIFTAYSETVSNGPATEPFSTGQVGLFSTCQLSVRSVCNAGKPWISYPMNIKKLGKDGTPIPR